MFRCVVLLLPEQVKSDKAVTKVLHCSQEQKMMEHFSDIVLRIKAEGASALVDFWPRVTLQTQV